MKKLLILLLLLFVSVASAQKVIKTEKVTNHSIHITGDKFEGVIFTEMYTGNSPVKEFNPKFTPSQNDINIAEKLIKSGLNVINNKDGRFKFIHHNLKKYLRQYFGFIDSKGQKIIYVSLFWNDPINKNGQGWFVYPIRIMDGGKYCWRIKINLTTLQSFDFSINGEA